MSRNSFLMYKFEFPATCSVGIIETPLPKGHPSGKEIFFFIQLPSTRFMWMPSGYLPLGGTSSCYIKSLPDFIKRSTLDQAQGH